MLKEDITSYLESIGGINLSTNNNLIIENIDLNAGMQVTFRINVEDKHLFLIKDKLLKSKYIRLGDTKLRFTDNNHITVFCIMDYFEFKNEWIKPLIVAGDCNNV